MAVPPGWRPGIDEKEQCLSDIPLNTLIIFWRVHRVPVTGEYHSLVWVLSSEFSVHYLSIPAVPVRVT